MTDSPNMVCHDCLKSLKPVPAPICPRCGAPTTGSDPSGTVPCLTCLANPPAYDKARFGLVYEGELRKALVRFKYHEGTYVGRTLSDFLAQAFHNYFKPGEFDLIIPMPMHPRRLFKRGFNQVVIMGERLSAQTGIPLDRFSFRKIKDTPPQVGLSRTRRAENVRASFAVTRPDRIRNRSLLLLDDVSTTGATVAEASRTIVQGGADRVAVLVLALRMPHASINSEGPLEETPHSCCEQPANQQTDSRVEGS